MCKIQTGRLGDKDVDVSRFTPRPVLEVISLDESIAVNKMDRVVNLHVYIPEDKTVIFKAGGTHDFTTNVAIVSNPGASYVVAPSRGLFKTKNCVFLGYDVAPLPGDNSAAVVVVTLKNLSNSKVVMRNGDLIGHLVIIEREVLD